VLRADGLEVVADLERGALLRALLDHSAEERERTGTRAFVVAGACADDEAQAHHRQLVPLDDEDAKPVLELRLHHLRRDERDLPVGRGSLLAERRIGRLGRGLRQGRERRKRRGGRRRRDRRRCLASARGDRRCQRATERERERFDAAHAAAHRPPRVIFVTRPAIGASFLAVTIATTRSFSFSQLFAASATLVVVALVVRATSLPR
jgi:hypothetical protein